MTDLAQNRKAFFDYEIEETFEAGIVLQGTEVKSLKNHDANLQDAYIAILKNELWILGGFIGHYTFGNIHNHEEKRDRKLLMHKKEIEKLKKQTQQGGMTLIPLAFVLKKGIVKVRFGLAKGKKKGDKRASLKEKDSKRELQIALKNSSF